MLDIYSNAIFNASRTAIVSKSGKILKISQGFANLIGYPIQVLEEKYYQELIHPEDLNKNNLYLDKLAAGENDRYELEERYIHKQGFTLWLAISMVTFKEETGSSLFVITAHDITDRKQKEEQLEYLVTHDLLTNLYNRALFNESLKQTVIKCSRYSCCDYLVYIDINKFRAINDEYSQEVGDYCLKILGSRLKDTFRDTDEVFRLDSDHFAVLLHNMEDQPLTYLIERLLSEAQKPLVYVGEDTTISLKLSIAVGICEINTIQDENTALAIAQRAMYRAKVSRSKDVDYGCSIEIHKEIELEKDIREAILNNEFEVYYQPIRQLNNMKLVGHEALLRWPSRNISPLTVLEVAEKMNLVERLEWDLLTKILSNAPAESKAGRWISVNLNSLLHTKRFREELKQLLEEHNVESHSIAFEVIETIKHSDPVVRLLIDIKNDGHPLKLDDFARDHASFAWLKTLPLDTVKIDREFIHGIADDRKLQAITLSMLDVCHSLGFKVVAEGIQREEDLEWLKKADCDQGQGFNPSLGIPAKQLRKR